MSVTWFDGVTVTVEAALSAAIGSYGVWDTSTWDSATWGPDDVWVDITSYVRSGSIDRGFGRDLQAWEAGRAMLELDNRDGRFSPTNLSGPYVTGGITEVRPMRPVRISATYAGVTYRLFRGYVTDWQEGWSLAANNAGDAVVRTPCVDELARLAKVDGLEQAPAGAGELSGLRIHRILDNAGHTGGRAIDPGQFSMQATTLASNTVTELKVTADSESGGLFVDSDGSVVYEGGYALIENARSNTVQATFGDSTGELPYTEIVGEYSGALLVNIASFARVGGTTQTSADLTSRALYQDARYTRTDLANANDADVAQLAAWHVTRYSQPEDRFVGITIAPHSKDAATLYPQVFGRRVRDLVQVIRRPPGGFTITRNCFISGVHHAFSPADWRTSFDLWSATPYLTVGRWDVATWDSSTWFF